METNIAAIQRNDGAAVIPALHRLDLKLIIANILNHSMEATNRRHKLDPKKKKWNKKPDEDMRLNVKYHLVKYHSLKCF